MPAGWKEPGGLRKMKKTTWAFLLVMLFAAAGHGGEEKGRKELFRIRSGKVVMEPAYDQVLSFSDGLAGVNRGGGLSSGPRPTIAGGRWGFIDRSGKVVIPPRFDFVGKFQDGIAPVNVGGVKEGKWGYIDKTGNMVIPPRFDQAREFSDGLARVKVGDKTGYIDKAGKYVWNLSR
jgi:hypothetical protein